MEKMNTTEALIQFRDDMKKWVTNNLNAVGGSSISIEDLEGIDTESMELLWENPNPTSSFAAQTISLDLSNYSYVVITFIAYTGWLTRKHCLCDKKDSHFVEFFNANNDHFHRSATVIDDGVIFNKGNKGTTEDNTACIPVKIVGIKPGKSITINNYGSGSGTSNANVIYNPDTDNIDVYDGEELKGSIATGFNEPIALVPVLSANTEKLIYSSEYSSDYAAYKAFDGSNTVDYDAWSAASDDTIGGYIGYLFNSKKTVTKVLLKNRGTGGYVEYATLFKLQGSNDLNDWHDIQTFTVSITEFAEEEYFIVDNPQSFLAFRIVILGAQRSTVCIGELQFYGYNEIGVALPKATKSITVDDSDVFSIEKTYAVGDYCIYNDILYKFTGEKAAGEWDDSVVEATTVVKEIGGSEKEELVNSYGVTASVKRIGNTKCLYISGKNNTEFASGSSYKIGEIQNPNLRPSEYVGLNTYLSQDGVYYLEMSTNGVITIVPRSNISANYKTMAFLLTYI